jgi:hypothetical protein
MNSVNVPQPHIMTASEVLERQRVWSSAFDTAAEKIWYDCLARELQCLESLQQ